MARTVEACAARRDQATLPHVRFCRKGMMEIENVKAPVEVNRVRSGQTRSIESVGG